MGMYGTKEELEDTEDFYPFVYIPINVIWVELNFYKIIYILFKSDLKT